MQDAIRNEHGRDFMGAHIVVEWSRGGRGESSRVRVHAEKLSGFCVYWHVQYKDNNVLFYVQSFVFKI